MNAGSTKVLVGDGRYEAIDFIEDTGREDTFCLTTTTGTWTTIADDDDRPIWTGNSGGRGLIGWTPPSTISDADFQGGMATQLPAILRFVTSSGDSGVIAEMFQATSVAQAANEWGKGVERYGINDVHSEGITLATQIAGLKKGGLVGSAVGRYDSGGWLPPGISTAINNTGQSERVTAPGTMTTGERAILAELRAIKIATQNAPASFGRSISGGVARGVSRGYYGS
jgi:hypothetical protein